MIHPFELPWLFCFFPANFTCVWSGLHPPPSKVPVMDPYRHRQLLHDRWINRASQRLGDIATLKYGSVKEFFRVSAVHAICLDPFRRRHPQLYGMTPNRCPTYVLSQTDEGLTLAPAHTAMGGKGGKYKVVLHNVFLGYCDIWAFVCRDVPSDSLHGFIPLAPCCTTMPTSRSTTLPFYSSRIEQITILFLLMGNVKYMRETI